MTACRLVIADDHPLFRDALRLTIAQCLLHAEVAEADSFESLCRLLSSTPDTDLVFLDLNMPGMRGLSGLLFVRAEFSSVPVAVISASGEPRVMRRALDLGAAGYIPKSTPRAEICAALKMLLAGQSWTPASLDLSHGADATARKLARQLASLTPQQIRVLMMLSEGFLNKQIAHALEVSEGTVKAHVSAVLQKLGVVNRTQAVLIARQLSVELDAAEMEILRQAEAASPQRH